jgi:hypothetical protein
MYCIENKKTLLCQNSTKRQQKFGQKVAERHQKNIHKVAKKHNYTLLNAIFVI